MLGLSWMHILVLLAAGLFVLGPERLPQAAAWLGKTVRQLRQFTQNAQRQLREEMGPEFEEFRRPLEDLRQLRNFDPRRAITQHLFDGETDPLGLAGGATRQGNGAPVKPPPIDPDAT
ncbi:Sec-independent protein translocase protein TatB [Amycolatopsis sp. GM8]|uniref:Sec-independent protein translocase protein TatB n=1 Tax=Amycolatopsis sp. GM8 TaxID=2896530 RepID=UPI001F0103AE|nr:Sec-independent protein translocase protein TatB [Amycolatopsis sp. GM8]